MVATDIAARGIHVDGIDLVIHADPPAEHKAYLHRSGRTARAGADGVVVTMQTPAQAREVRDLMRKAGVTPQVAEADPGSAVVREIAGPPAQRVTLLHRAADLVQPADRLSERPAARQPGTGRPARGKPRQRAFRTEGAGRPSRAQHGPADATARTARQFNDRGDRTVQRFDDRGDRPARQFDDRGEGSSRRFDDRSDRPAPRFDDRGGRPVRQFDDRGRDLAAAGPSSRGAGERSWRGNGAGPESGSQRGGAGVRSGYPGRRSAGGNRRNSGQGRHS
jgi:superfamily II DNA/RNA helicase